MANQPYISGQVSVGNSATLVASPTGLGGILVSVSATTYFGGAGVTSGTGFSVSSGSPVMIPTQGPTHDLYAVTASSSTVSYIYPGGN